MANFSGLQLPSVSTPSLSVPKISSYLPQTKYNIPKATEFSDYVCKKYPTLEEAIEEYDEEIGTAAFTLKSKLETDIDIGSLKALFGYVNNEYHKMNLYAEITGDISQLEDANAKFEVGMNACMTIINTILQGDDEAAKLEARDVFMKIITRWIYPGL